MVRCSGTAQCPKPLDPQREVAVNSVCPVPIEQRPLQQYEELSNSCFFGWADPDVLTCLKPLGVCWLLNCPLCVLIASGSVPLQQHPLRMVVAGMVAALALPLLLLVRQWLGWTFILRRLLATTIEYEKSGWYDGQRWEKPVEWRQQDLLVARYQVRPLLHGLRESMALLAALLLAGAALCRIL